MVDHIPKNREYNLNRLKSKHLICLFCFMLTLNYCIFSPSVFPQDDTLQFIEKKQRELKEREDALSKEEERLKAIRKDLDDRMEKYSKLLTQIEGVLKKLEQVHDDKLDRVVKTYEFMPPEEAAAQLSALPEIVAVKIFTRMKPKKAGSVMAYIEPKKAAALTESMTKFEKNFPPE